MSTVEQQQNPPIAVLIAWRAYLRTTRDAPPEEYEQVEERAWERLADELRRHGSTVEP
jgi:hypothetical protein